MKLRRAAVSAIVALTLSIAASLTGCGKQPQLVEVTHQVVLIFDVSGSTKPLASGWAARADRYAKQLKDGTRVLVAVADGASGSSLCIPRRVQLQGQGKDQLRSGFSDCATQRLEQGHRGADPLRRAEPDRRF